MHRYIAAAAAAALFLTGCARISEDNGEETAFAGGTISIQTAQEDVISTSGTIISSETTATVTDAAEKTQTETISAVPETASATVAPETQLTEQEEQTTAKPPEISADVVFSAVEDMPGNDCKCFEVYSQADIAELLDGSGIGLAEDITIDTSVKGDFRADITYEDKGEKSVRSVYYSVRDTAPPVVLNSGWSNLIITGDEFDIYDIVGVGDYYDTDITITYTGDVDTSAAGDYPITVYASDSSGNSTDWQLTIAVRDEYPSYTEGGDGSSDATPFGEYLKDSAKAGILGIDVSKWQGDIDFDAVKAAGCEFVIMRIGADIDGIYEDTYYRKNIEGAEAAGLRTGIYIYTTANSEEEIRAEAEWINNVLSGRKLDLPIAFDWEDFACYQQYNISIHDMNGLYALFDECMESYGYDTMLYGGKYNLRDFWQTDSKVWLAHYTDQTDYTGDYSIWQFSCTGSIDGIYGYVDVNVITDEELLKKEQ
ncbi:MAG: glycoside hydrolase family 25 [Oscillospiraceae bacterium]|nr:glycoside hydrolase family 25 [Oscillospiraceae bacterium]